MEVCSQGRNDPRQRERLSFREVYLVGCFVAVIEAASDCFFSEFEW